MTHIVGTLPVDARGFDCNVPLSTIEARAMVHAGYQFVMRYLPRLAPAKPHDLSRAEIVRLHYAGLAIGAVQHCLDAGWKPNRALGARYGGTAATEAKRLGLPLGVTLWCDLEGVREGTPAAEVIAYGNAWYDAVLAGGYEPGLYVGDHCGLSAHDLYYRLKFQAYWSSYNLNDDELPIVRGVQMRQWRVRVPQRVDGIEFAWDGDTVGVDALGGRPLFFFSPAG
jgi:hypothetical protein